MDFLDPRLPERFWARVSPCPVSGCWLWLGPTNGNGYGAHGTRAIHSGSQLVHRFTYEIAVGSLPPETEIDHRVCQNRECCNPAHLEAVPHVVNVRRGKTKKTHCVRGHELAGDNLMQTPRGTRCRACANADSRERKRRKYVPRKRQLTPTCARGHAMRHNGKRRICDECARLRRSASDMPAPPRDKA